MGTRGAWGFRVDGQDKIAYNQYDSYPGGLGQDLVAAIKRTNLTDLKTAAQNLLVINEKTPPSLNQMEQLQKYADLAVSNRRLDDWYCLLRKNQGDLEQTLQSGHMLDGHNFLKDSLYCEHAYVINLDENKFEVYAGFQEKPHQKGRFAELPTTQHYAGGRTYYPVALVAEFALDQLPDNLHAALPQDEE